MISKISAHLEEYHNNFSFASDLHDQLEILADYLCLLLGCDRTLTDHYDRYRIHFAVDFLDIFPFLFTDLWMDSVDQGSPEFKHRPIINECLFSNFFSIVLTLLPPYEIELINRLYIEKKKIDRVKDAFANLNMAMWKKWSEQILGKQVVSEFLSASPGDPSSSEIRTKLLEYIKMNFSDLFSLASLSYERAHSALKNLMDCRRLVRLLDYPINIDIDETAALKDAHATWLPIFSDIRRNVFYDSSMISSRRITADKVMRDWTLSNYIDSLAFSYVSQINRLFMQHGRKEVLILMTSSKAAAVASSMNETSLVLKTDNVPRGVSVVQSPWLCLTYLQYMEGRTDFYGTLKAILDAIKLLNDYIKYKDLVDKLFDKKEIQEYDVQSFLNWANEKLPNINRSIRNWRNLTWANKDRRLFNEMQEHFVIKPDSILKRIASEKYKRMVHILELLMDTDIQKKVIAGEIDNLIGDLHADYNMISFKIATLLEPISRSRSPLTDYMIDFQNPSVSEIYRCIFGEDASKASINSQVQRLIKMKEDNPDSDVTLLFAYCLGKLRLDDAALSELQRGEKTVSTLDERRRYQFIRNTINARKPAMILATIKCCSRLIKGDPEEPRYHLQKGFFIWRCIRLDVPNTQFSMDDAIECMEKAKQLADKHGMRNVLRVAYFDSMIIHFQRGNYNEVVKAYNFLNMSKKDSRKGAVFHFSEALYYWARGRTKGRREDYLHAQQEMRAAIEKRVKEPLFEEFYLRLSDEIKNIYD